MHFIYKFMESITYSIFFIFEVVINKGKFAHFFQGLIIVSLLDFYQKVAFVSNELRILELATILFE